ncbi:DUF862 domain-containing protein [Citrus sinensis]|uniref:DUF862 domain-containing protein n=1 Tax=Citrus sinensis TaxID=2711 RepID=A0ACB8MV92_CITSI|nr:DUF862 domain-containing protein [Citrus sinensis]KAH9789305.1 DUF862 domain-containing protein [Citrus sinensis]
MLAMDERVDEHVPVEIEKLADSSSTVNTGATEKAMAHEDENEHVPIDMKKLADSLSGKLETLPPLSTKCSIYRVAEPRRCSNPSHYTPQMVSIGPFHHDLSGFLPIEEKLFENHFSKAAHFLDLFMLCLQPSQSRAPLQLKYPTVPGAKELHQAGVKFKAGSSKNLLDIKFEKGILEIPFIPVYEKTELLCRNLLAFEWLHDYTPYFNDYIIMIGWLITAPKDAELLFENEIVGLSEELPTMFGNLSKDCTLVLDGFLYSGLLADLYIYRKSPWHKWKATLKQNYFNTPRASISVIAAVILLLLTVTQTVCSLVAL